MEEQVAARIFLLSDEIRKGGLAQLGEHLPCKQGVESSNLLVSTAAGKRRHRNLREGGGKVP